jgi:Leucine-rich repeat (LRR) protein
MDFKARVKYQWVIFFSLFFLLQTTSKPQTVLTENQFDSLKIIENGETPAIAFSGHWHTVGDTIDLFFKRILNDGTLIDFKSDQLFRIKVINKDARTYNILLPNGKLVYDTVVSLPLKLVILEPGRGDIKVYALNPEAPPDSVRRTLSAPNNIMKAKYLGAMGINKLRLREFDKSRKYFLESAKVDSVLKGDCYYNIACTYALENDTLNSLKCLRVAFENGFDKISYALKEDNDLESIRNLPEFKPIVTMSLIKERNSWLSEIENGQNSNIKGVNCFLIAESYLKQVDPDSFFVWIEKAFQNAYCPEAGFFEAPDYNLICNDNRFDSLLIFYSDIAETIKLPDDIILQKPYLVKRLHADKIPDLIGKFINLRELWISGNQVKSIPEQIINCKALSSLSIEKSSLGEFPIIVTKLASLKSLIIKNDNFSNIPDDILGNNGLDTLCLINDCLSSIPNPICKLINLKSLILKDNYLTGLPARLSLIKALANLDISGNRFNSIPDVILNFKRLTSLDIHENLIGVIPPQIQNLGSLKYLDISLNNISSLPEEICNLDSLKYLDISFNNLTALPVNISKLKNLERIIIWGNKISEDKIKDLHSALPQCKIIGKEQNAFSYKKFTNSKMITDTFRGIVFTYPEDYEIGYRMPDDFFKDTSITISVKKIYPFDTDYDMKDNNDTTTQYVERTCSISIFVSKENFVDAAVSSYFGRNESLISSDTTAENNYMGTNSWISIGRHNNEEPVSALNLNQWKGFYGTNTGDSDIVTKSGEYVDEYIHDFFLALAIKKMNNGNSIIILTYSDIDTANDLFGNILSSIRYVGE